MKVLFLRRQNKGGLANYSDSLVKALAEFGVEVTINDASEWIPNETGWWGDRAISKELRRISEGYDLVHAWGYRAAWACGEAFKLNRPWVYTAWDMPKTRNSQLIDRLNHARAGVCTSYPCRTALEEVHTLHLHTVMPGIDLPNRVPEREEARKTLGLPLDVPVVAAAGRFVAERGFTDLIEQFREVWNTHPDAMLVIAGAGPEKEKLESLARHSQIEILPWGPPWSLYASADIVVVPSTRQSFSMVALEAMAASRPVLVRRTGGLPEMAVEHVALRAFHGTDDLATEISSLLSDDQLCASLSYAARVRVEDRFSLSESAGALSRVLFEAKG